MALMIVYVYRQRQKHLGKVQKFAELDSNGENGDTYDPKKSYLPPLLSNLPILPPPQVKLRATASMYPVLRRMFVDISILDSARRWH